MCMQTSQYEVDANPDKSYIPVFDPNVYEQKRPQEQSYYSKRYPVEREQIEPDQLLRAVFILCVEKFSDKTQRKQSRKGNHHPHQHYCHYCDSSFTCCANGGKTYHEVTPNQTQYNNIYDNNDNPTMSFQCGDPTDLNDDAALQLDRSRIITCFVSYFLVLLNIDGLSATEAFYLLCDYLDLLFKVSFY